APSSPRLLVSATLSAPSSPRLVVSATLSGAPRGVNGVNGVLRTYSAPTSRVQGSAPPPTLLHAAAAASAAAAAMTLSSAASTSAHAGEGAQVGTAKAAAAAHSLQRLDDARFRAQADFWAGI
ncbi:unnamed protein product, partial [Polarella glacialis]